MKPILVCLAVVGLLAACEKEQHAEGQPPRPVLTIVAAPQAAPAVGFAGTIEPRYSSDLGFRVLGRIVSRDVDVGEVVEKGQQLAALDQVAFQLAVRSAEADLASAIAQLENAAAIETRKLALLAKDVDTQAQFEAAEQARESAAAAVTGAEPTSTSRGATRLHRASCTVRRGHHRCPRRTRASGPARGRLSSLWPARIFARR